MPVNIEELRAAERFAAVDVLTATFAGAVVTIVNLSTIGAQIEHSQPIRLGATGRFSIRRGDVSIDVPGSVTWSRLAGGGSYRSGVRIEHGNADYALGLHMLIKGGAMRRDPDTLERKRRRLLERMAGQRSQFKPATDNATISPDQILLVQHARERLLSEPEEAQRWYQRAKYAITHGASNVEIESIRNREEVLAVWEYLERSIDIATIARAFDFKTR
jgi:hypothetical protein